MDRSILLIILGVMIPAAALLFAFAPRGASLRSVEVQQPRMMQHEPHIFLASTGHRSALVSAKSADLARSVFISDSLNSGERVDETEIDLKSIDFSNRAVVPVPFTPPPSVPPHNVKSREALGSLGQFASGEDNAECQRWFESISPPESTGTATTKGFTSQGGQDRWAYENVFRHLEQLTGRRKGVYVDLAAAFPKRLSNTWFFDVCLGWRGLCIEGDPAKRRNFVRLGGSRSCRFVPSVVSDSTEPVRFTSFGSSDAMEDNWFGASMAHIEKVKSKNTTKLGSMIELKPQTLQSVLEEHQIEEVDLLSLDVESHELEVLRSVDFNKVLFNVILMEKAGNGIATDLLKMNGYVRLGSVSLSVPSTVVCTHKLVLSRRMNERNSLG